MKNLISRYTNVTTTAIITLWCCLAQADDIDVYRGGSVEGSPVALLVIDTSGSMTEQEVVDTPEYDPTTNYRTTYTESPSGEVINYQFDTNLYYFSDSYSDEYLFRDDIADLLQRPFPAKALACQSAAASIATQGQYQSIFKRWNTVSSIWEPTILSAGSGSGSTTGTYFNDKFDDFNSFNEFYDSFPSKKKFKKFKKTFKQFLNDFEDDFSGDAEDEFEDTFNEDYKDFKRFDDIDNIGDFKDIFNNDFQKFKNFFNQAVSGGNGGSVPPPETPTGNTSDESAIIECQSDGGIHPVGEFVNTDTTNTAQYKNINDGQWDYYFKYVYHGNYLNYKIYSNYFEDEKIQTRMQITVNAAKHMVNTTGGINLGLSSFNYDAGGNIDVAVNNIDTIRPSLLNMLDSYYANGWTPLSENYYEAALYLRGDEVDYGGNSAAAATSGDRYISPIISGCQSTSNIVLFTDGEPKEDVGANSKIHSLLNAAGIKFETEPGLDDWERAILSNDCSGHGGCAEELAYYLANVDQRPDLAGMQTIHTHTIGGFFDETSSSDTGTLQYMENIAHFGKGSYSAASSKEEIVESFKEAVTVIIDKPVTFVAPSVAANSYNSLEHLDQLYYAMFVPSADNNWSGNLKSYRLSPDGLVVDAEGNSAIDKTSGLFKEASRSFWTEEGVVDGGDVTLGGAASNLTENYNIFTNLTGNKARLTQRLTTSEIPKEMVGLSASDSDAEHAAAIDWLNRRTPQGGARQQMEDPLHSRPVVVSYGYSQDESSKRITSDGVVFVGTNSGYLHAFKADKNNFEEYFSFIPKELLKNGNLYRTKDEDQTKAYGIDGPINYWHVDANQDLQVDKADGEKVFLYFGLRRGGRHYYALDVTDRTAPKFQWQISGGQGGDFDKLGQSWSPMTLAKVKWGKEGKTKVVLLLGGGYDPDEDNRDARAAHSMGNSIYMIDPEFGTLLWSASNSNASVNLPEMTSAITSEIKPVDFDGDQIIDYFFVSDIGGRVWRFDLNAEPEDISASNFIAKAKSGTGPSAGVIFDANAGSTNYQRFYDSPSISYFSNNKTKEKFLTISIGSGFRAAPLRTGERDTKDSFYIIKDKNITSAPDEYKAPLRNTFRDIATSLQTVDRTTVPVWKFDLRDGEKVLSTPLTSNGNIYFTTFSPSTTVGTNSCSAEIGSSRVYAIDFIGYNTSSGGNDSTDPGDPSDPTGSNGPNGPNGTTDPIITMSELPNIGIPPAVIELNITEDGQELFCESNPTHPSCQDDPCVLTNTCPDDCESTGSVILSGSNIIGGGALRCDVLKKDYWRAL